MRRTKSIVDVKLRSGVHRSASTEQDSVQRRNLLLICRDVLNGPGRSALSSAAVSTAALVLRATPDAQQLVAQLFYGRGEWHRLSKLAGNTAPAAKEEALRQLCREQLARNTFAAEAEDQAALLSLLKTDEMKGLGGASMQKNKNKRKTSDHGATSGDRRKNGWAGGGGALDKLRTIAALLQDIRSHMQPSPLWTELARRLGPHHRDSQFQISLWQL